MNYSLPMQFAASWIALEDIAENSGELFYFAGGHRIPETIYGGHYKGMEEAARIQGDRQGLDAEHTEHMKRIEASTKGRLPEHRFLAKKGDVLLWAADFPHGGSPVSEVHTRKSVVAHYCPADVAPSYFELHPGRQLREHDGVAYYASGHYDR